MKEEDLKGARSKLGLKGEVKSKTYEVMAECGKSRGFFGQPFSPSHESPSSIGRPLPRRALGHRGASAALSNLPTIVWIATACVSLDLRTSSASRSPPDGSVVSPFIRPLTSRRRAKSNDPECGTHSVSRHIRPDSTTLTLLSIEIISPETKPQSTRS